MQAQETINRFKGAYELAAEIGVSAPTVYRWTHPVPRGTGGYIPPRQIPKIIEAANRLGIDISDLV